MIRLAATLALCMLVAAVARAESVVLGLSQNQVAITATFDGSSILIFGAVKREAPLPPGRPLDVVVTVTGPPVTTDVRKKERLLGIWVNTEAVRYRLSPSFYAVASTAPLGEVLTETENLRHRISLDRAIRTVGATSTTDDVPAFTDALVRLREADGLYQVLTDGVSLDQQTLFRTEIKLPAKLVEGNYQTRIYLVRDGKIVDDYETVIDVHKVGLERWLSLLAHDHPPIYAVLSLIIAVFAGWGASALFRMFQR